MIIMVMNASQAVEQYSDYVELEEKLSKELQERTEALIPQEIRDEIEALKAEYQPKLNNIRQEISLLEGVLKDYVLTVGETLKGNRHYVVYSKGRVSWDTKSLDGYAKAHTELLVFRSEGNPSASIRKSGK